MSNDTRKTVGILIFDDVEVLDFAGPFEVFSRTRLVAGVDSRRSDDGAPFDTFTVARTRDVVTAIGGLKVIPHYSWADAPAIDILVVPGGFGTRALLNDEPTLAWIREKAARASQVTSVCTGALLLAKVGLLSGRRATTHWAGLDLLASLDPTIQVQREARVVSDGVVTSAGVSAGIDMAFTVVERLCGRAVADETAHYIEYVPKYQTLFNFDPPATDEEIRAASVQFVRKLSGFNAPSKANEPAFDRAVDDVAAIARRLIDSLETAATPRNREEVAARVRERAAERFAPRG
jgi:transcriptional regulator GlxA family with amidase domain